MNWLRAYIAQSPRTAVVLGKVLFLAGAIMIVSAVFARAGLEAANTARVQAKLPALRTVAEAYPQYPTWLVPETPVGFTIAAVLVLVGMGLALLGQEEAKQQKGQRGA